MGPVASQEAIKLLGTNGGGFFNVNSAHPFENPNGFTNFVEMLSVLVIPAALVFMYGKMSGNRRQGYAIFATMMIMFLGAAIVAYIAEAHGSPAQHAAGLHTHVFAGSTGGNLEGKEQRFGIAGSALFDVVTTVTSCGAVNSAIESFTGIGGAVPFANLSASEVIFGGVGTGLYSILLYVLLAVFIGGLMVGRTPEYLGKKIEAREIKLVVLGLLVTPLMALFSTALATASKAGRASISAAATGPQGFSETFYAYLSQANNNGSAFAGYTGYIQPNAGNLGAHGVKFADLLGGFTMLFARYAPILFALAVAGTLAGKRDQPRRPRHDADRQPDVRRAADRRDRARRRAHLLPRPAARPDRPGPDRTPLLTVMRKDIITSAIGIVVLTLLCGIVYPLARHRRQPGRFPRQRQRPEALCRRQARRLEDHRPAVRRSSRQERQAAGRQERQPGHEPRPEVLPEPARRRRYRAGQRGRRRAFSNLGPNSVATEQAIAANIAGLHRAREAATYPGLTAAHDPGRRGQQLRVGHRPGHLGRQRRHPGAPGRAVRHLSLCPGRSADLRVHPRTRARVLRRARRQRAAAQPRPRRPQRRPLMSTTTLRHTPRLPPRERQAISLFRRDIVNRALIDSLMKLDPRVQIRNPVMFVVEVGAVITTVTWLIQVFGGKPLGGGNEPAWYAFTISIWLWLTVVFANMAEAFAEGRGRAQADTLRSMRQETVATMQGRVDEAAHRS